MNARRGNVQPVKSVGARAGGQRAVEHPTLPCPAKAVHENVYVDHCMTCAPNWNRVPAYVGMSREAQFLLMVLGNHERGELDAPGLPDCLHEASEELMKHGYVELGEVEVKRRGSTSWFHVYRLTRLGLDAFQKMDDSGRRSSFDKAGRIERRRVK